MSSPALTTSAFVLAAVAAIRSTWSPCGLSMLSTLTPLSERSRGHRYPVTVGWFVGGAIAGGAILGAGAAALARAVSAWSPSTASVAIVVLVASVVAIASDVGLAGFALPTIPRQVDEVWTGRYRPWVYAAGFGAQIGVGVSTYVMTAAVYLVVVLAALTGSPLVALLVGTSFGLVRGLAILLGVRLSTPERLRRFHQRFEASAPISAGFARFGQVVAVGIATQSWWWPVPVAVLATVPWLRRLRTRRAGAVTARPV